MPGNNRRTNQTPLFSPGISSQSSNKYLWNLSGGRALCKSITADSKIIINDNNKNVCPRAGARDRERGNKGPQGGVGEARSLETREAAMLASQPSLWLCDSRKWLTALSGRIFAITMWTHQRAVHKQAHSVPDSSPGRLRKSSPPCRKAPRQHMLFYLLLSF